MCLREGWRREVQVKRIRALLTPVSLAWCKVHARAQCRASVTVSRGKRIPSRSQDTEAVQGE